MPDRLVVGLSGSTGARYGVRLLEVLSEHFPSVETHLILSSSARLTIDYELGRRAEDVATLASLTYDDRNIGAAIASGTFLTRGMVVCPCSIKTLSAVATSHADSLITRAADVTLKERRRLVLVVRETPLHLTHLRLMTQVTEAGAVIAPPSPAFYHRPETIADVVDHTIVKVLDLFGLHTEGLIARWDGLPDD